MTTVRIARVIKYKGVVYPANVDILVDDADVQDLLKRGGWVINKEAPAKDAGAAENAGAENVGSSTADITDSDADSNKDDDAGASGDAKDDELKELCEYAEALGIEVKKNWGITKLKKEIAAAETN